MAAGWVNAGRWQVTAQNPLRSVSELTKCPRDKGHRTGVYAFRDRSDAGERLAKELQERALQFDLVLALPRGGVPVAAPIAAKLNLPLDVLVVRKLGVPSRSELAMGALASGGHQVLNRDVLGAARVDEETLQLVVEREEAELRRREELYRGDNPQPQLNRKRVLLVDDGLATGASMRVAVQAARGLNAAAVSVAVPVAAPDVLAVLGEQVDELVCLLAPPNFGSVGAWFESFEQVEDEEVRETLELHRSRLRSQS